MKKKILIVTSAFERVHFLPFLDTWMEESSHDCHTHDSEDAAGFITVLDEFAPHILVGAWDMPALPLSAVASQGGSVEYFCFLPGSAKKQITSDHLAAGLVFTNWGTWIGPYVAECALLLTLGALRRVAHWGHQLKTEGIWRDRLTHNHSLFRKRVGLHGFGSIAQSLVELMRPFDPIVTADTGVPDEILDRHAVKRAASTEALFAESDVLIELKPLTDHTRGSVDETLLRLLPEGACFVNIGRGPVVDEAALIRVAQERKLQVGLDVYAVEPLPLDSPLRTMPNVFMLPHMGGATIDRGIYCGQRALQNVENYISGQPLDNQVTVEGFERAT
ncbi:MAG: phosphoglycerate dehydrogenase-like enzyme [Candidatus Pelagisphaera sp.]|jgi:phosphoglycerate dehydrogenase-like enzyme